MAKRNRTNRRRLLRIEPLEQRALLAITVNTLQDVVDANDGMTSLREAVIAANATQAADTINFAPGLTAAGQATISLTQHEISVTRPLTINGPGSQLLTIDASASDPTPDLNNLDGSRIFNVQGVSSPVSISGLRLMGGDTQLGGAITRTGDTFGLSAHLILRDVVVEQNSGGGVYVRGNASIADSVFQDNLTIGNGGGLAVNGNLNLVNSIVTRNTAGDLSGGIDQWQGNVLVDNCQITFNTARNGGGIQTAGPIVEIRNSNISNNRAIGGDFGGGGLFNRDHWGNARLTIDSCTFSDNLAEVVPRLPTSFVGGGGLFQEAYDPVTVITNSTFTRNSAIGGANVHGGGLHVRDTFGLRLIDSLVTGNQASGRGGGVFGRYGSASIEYATIDHNTAGAGGGGMAFDLAKLLRTTVSNNHTTGDAAHGGGVSVQYSMEVTDSAISGNYTLGNQAKGGGIYGAHTLSNAISVTSTRSTISGNYTRGINADGGGIALRSAVRLLDSSITGNSALGESSDGGGVFADFVEAFRSTIVHNAANTTNGVGGGIFTPTGIIQLQSSIVARNTDAGTAPDVYVSHSRMTTSSSLIGNTTGAGLITGLGNILNQDPMLGPLADNGGLTLTHALLPGSPAIDAGHSVGAQLFDQRGAPWLRVVDGSSTPGARADIGSFELQPNPLPGDYSFNGIVDAADYVLWRKLLASTTDLRADGSGNAAVDQPDYVLWRQRFGQPAQTASGDLVAASILDAADAEPEPLDAPLLDAKASPAWRAAAKAIVAVPVVLNKVTDDDPLLTAFLESAGQDRPSAGDMPAIGVESGAASINIDESLAIAVDRAFELLSH